MTKQKLETLSSLAAITFICLVIHLITRLPLFLYLATGFLFIGIFIQPVAKIIAALWIRFAKLIGSINTKIILCLIYFLVLVPVSFLFKLFSGNPLLIKWGAEKNTFWQERNHFFEKKDLKNVW